MLSELGDTLVEVVIVLAVLGMAISISYATANRSLLNARQAQENAEATELVQSQVENLRRYSDITVPTDPNYVYDTTPFCFNAGSKQTAGGGNCTLNSRYAIGIVYSSLASPGGTFRVTAQWPDVSGEGIDSVVMSYRLYP